MALSSAPRALVDFEHGGGQGAVDAQRITSSASCAERRQVSRSASKRVDADDDGVLTVIAYRYFPDPASRSSPPAVSAIVGERPSRAS
jgi:hypothetical protein